RLRWLAGSLRDSVSARVWAGPGVTPGSPGMGTPCGGGGGGRVSEACEAMSLLLQDLPHRSMGRRVSARRALQAVLETPPTRLGDGGQGGAGDGDEDGGGQGTWGGLVAVNLEEADQEQCGWLFRCCRLPAWEEVAPLLVQAVRQALDFETSTMPVRYFLLALHWITGRGAGKGGSVGHWLGPGRVEGGAEGGGRGEVGEKEVKEEGKEEGKEMCRSWFFTHTLCRLLCRRKMVSSATLQRYPETFGLATDAVNAALRAVINEGVDMFEEERGWPPEARARLVCLDKGGGGEDT
ncbi:unnamed protein product, partial [Discosporangium mesarthrocarpum]